MLVGYARVSSADQNLESQEELLKAAGVERIFAEKQSGTTTQKRAELEFCLNFVREGDTLIITRLDRLARSVVDLHRILEQLGEKKVAFKCLQQPIDTSTSEGRLMLTILAAFAEFETEIRKERQMEGINRAKMVGAYKSNKPRARKADPEKIRELQRAGWNAPAIAKALKIGRSTVYRNVPDGWGPPPIVKKKRHASPIL